MTINEFLDEDWSNVEWVTTRFASLLRRLADDVEARPEDYDLESGDFVNFVSSMAERESMDFFGTEGLDF